MSQLTNLGVTASIYDIMHAFNPVALNITIQKSEAYGRGNYNQATVSYLSTIDGQYRSDDPLNRFFYYFFNFERGAYKKVIYPAVVIPAASDPDGLGCVFYNGSSYIQGSGVKGRDVAALNGQTVEIDIPADANAFGFCYYRDQYADQNGLPRADAITFVSPDELGDDTEIRINAGSNEAGFIDYRRNTYEAVTAFDLRAIAETLFDRKHFYNLMQGKDDVFCKQMTINIYRLNKGVEAFVGTLKTYVVWGALQIGETLLPYVEKFKYFPGYPFAISMLIDRDTKVRKRVDSNHYDPADDVIFEYGVTEGFNGNKTISVSEFNLLFVVDWDGLIVSDSSGMHLSTRLYPVIPGAIVHMDYTLADNMPVVGRFCAFAGYTNETDTVASEAARVVFPHYLQGSYSVEFVVPDGVNFIRLGGFLGRGMSVSNMYITNNVRESIDLTNPKRNIWVDEPDAKKRIVFRLEDDNDVPQPSIFTDPFDITFKNKSDDVRFIYVDVCTCNPKNSVYLRWVNKRGDYNFWLFRTVTNDASIEASDVRFNELFYTTRLTDPLNTQKYVIHNGTGLYSGKLSTHTAQLGAANVNSDDYDFLVGVLESPVVDMFLGYEGTFEKWVRVNVQPTSIVKTQRVLQDFRLSIDLPEIQTQNL